MGFSRRAEYCDKHRPRYPEVFLGSFESELGYSPKSLVADIESGTDILSEIFLKNWNMVFGVELLSSSFTPLLGEETHDETLARLAIFSSSIKSMELCASI